MNRTFGSRSRSSTGLIYKPQFVNSHERQELLNWIATLKPLWEYRHSTVRPLPSGMEQRRLLRPVYWLGNWQFACLNYFHPPKNIYNCCVEAEPFPPELQHLAHRIEREARDFFPARDIPHGWHFNTCLINFYGHGFAESGKKTDAARVGEHKDFEPGPVGSMSFGERALFQFVESKDRSARSQVVLQQWLEDSALQVFAGDRFKKRLFHRVQRVETKKQIILEPTISDFETRRINLTFRYVPREFIVPFHQLPQEKKDDVREYMGTLAQSSSFFLEALAKEACE